MTGSGVVDLTVLIPTFNRRDTLAATLDRLAEQETAFGFEIVVVDDGSTDGSAEVARSFAERTPLAVTVLGQPNSGPAAARNRGLAAARGRVSLFLGDDTWPRPDLVDRHCAFHRRRPETEAALLGRVVWAEACGPTRFMEWLGSEGVRFGFDQIRDNERLPGSFFYTSNVSAKSGFVRAHGGFDEAFRAAAFEDIELGLRLERAGMRLRYDPEAIVEHFHPTDLPGSLGQVRRSGRWARLLVERNSDWPVPRRPGGRHQLKAAALTVLVAAGVRLPSVRTVVWRFLCHEAYREGYWGISATGQQPVQIGPRLARLAARDPATRISKPPSGDPPRPTGSEADR